MHPDGRSGSAKRREDLAECGRPRRGHGGERADGDREQHDAHEGRPRHVQAGERGERPVVEKVEEEDAEADADARADDAAHETEGSALQQHDAEQTAAGGADACGDGQRPLLPPGADGEGGARQEHHEIGAEDRNRADQRADAPDRAVAG